MSDILLIFDQADTCDFLACPSSRLTVSDDTGNLTVLLNLSESTLCCSWIRDLWSAIGTEKLTSRVVNRLVPISVILESNFAAEDFSSDI